MAGKRMAGTLQRILGLFFPVTCIACGKDLPGDDYYRICDGCTTKIRLVEGLFCRKCGRPLPDGGAHCFDCRKKGRSHYEYARSAGVYEGLLRELIHKFKYQNKDYLDRLLGKMLIDAAERHKIIPETDAIIAVPLHWTKRMRRGYNQAGLLALRVAGHFGKPLIKRAVVRKKMTKTQIGLTREKRFENMKDSFAVRDAEAVRNKRILLIDDVCTTTATIDHCARALKKAGAKSVFALTLARD